MIETNIIQQIQILWSEYVFQNNGESIKKILNIDRKTIMIIRIKNKKSLYIISQWCNEDRICFGKKTIKKKENEIVAII